MSGAHCKHCERAIVLVRGTWVDPEASGDDVIWRETCDQHDTFTAEHEPAMPHCDMRAGCEHDVTMLDQDGFVYCEAHGLARRRYQPCRKLRPAELHKLARGEQIRKY